MARSTGHRRPAVTRRVLEILLATSTLLSATHAQEILRSYTEDVWSSALGFIDWIGDIDGDGYGDILVGDSSYAERSFLTAWAA